MYAIMKARYRYRIYPTTEPKTKLAQLFGCVRVVGNDSLAYCQQKYRSGEKKPTNAELPKRFITQTKKTAQRQWLSEVSNIPLQQSLNDLNQAYQNFFKSCQGERKGKPVKATKFKKRKSRQTARFSKGGFKIYQHQVYAAKIGQIKIIWSRELPAIPTSATVIKDSANRYFISFVVEIQPEKLPKTQSVGIDLGRKTFATFSNGKQMHPNH